MGDAGHHPLHQTHIERILERAETQGVEQRNRPCPHGEDVPQNSSNSRCSALKRLHCRGVVVAFNLERQAVATTEIHHAGIFPRPHQNPSSGGGKAPQQRPGISIATVLRPHHAEHSQFDAIRSPSKTPTDLIPIPRLQTFLPEGCHMVISRGIGEGDQD